MEATGTTRLQERQKCPQIELKHFEVNFGMRSSVTRCTAWTSILRQAFCFSQLGSRFLHRRLAWHGMASAMMGLDWTLQTPLWVETLHVMKESFSSCLVSGLALPKAITVYAG